jgi:hypothetical protein
MPADNASCAHNSALEGADRAQPRKGGKLRGGAYQIEFLFRIHPHLIQVKYRRVGQRGNASKALVDTARHPDPEAALSSLLNEEIASFEVKPSQNINPKEK